ncbi:MAG: DUF4116 domain-containing protein [Chlamydiae bacterium]|nr:DUF4116 domain-containing protein [Chlamydiota bacterium]
MSINFTGLDLLELPRTEDRGIGGGLKQMTSGLFGHGPSIILAFREPTLQKMVDYLNRIGYRDLNTKGNGSFDIKEGNVVWKRSDGQIQSKVAFQGSLSKLSDTVTKRRELNGKDSKPQADGKLSLIHGWGETSDDLQVRLEKLIQNVTLVYEKNLEAPFELPLGRDEVLRAVSEKNWALQHLSPELRADKEVVLGAVAKNGFQLLFAAPELRGDREVVFTAMKENPSALQFASPALKKNVSFILDIGEKYGWRAVTLFADPILKTDQAFMLAAIEVFPEMYRYGSTELLTNLEFLERAQEVIETAGQKIPEGLNKLFYPGYYSEVH